MSQSSKDLKLRNQETRCRNVVPVVLAGITVAAIIVLGPVTKPTVGQLTGCSESQPASQEPSPLLTALLERSADGEIPYGLLSEVAPEEHYFFTNIIPQPGSSMILVRSLLDLSTSHAFWDMATGKKVRDFVMSEEDIQLREFHPGGKRIIGQTYSAVYVIDAETGRADLITDVGEDAFVIDALHCCEGELVVTLDTNYKVCGWDIETKTKKFEIQQPQPESFQRIYRVYNSKHVIYAESDIKLIDTEAGKVIREISIPGMEEDPFIRVADDGKTAETTTSKGTFDINLATGEVREVQPEVDEGPVGMILPGGDVKLVWHAAEVQLWNMRDEEEIARFKALPSMSDDPDQQSRVFSRFSKSGGSFVAFSDTGMAFWKLPGFEGDPVDETDGQQVPENVEPPLNASESEFTKRLQAWQAKPGPPYEKINSVATDVGGIKHYGLFMRPGHNECVITLQNSRENIRRFELWDVEQGKVVRVIENDRPLGCFVLAISPDGNWLLASGGETHDNVTEGVHLINLETGEQRDLFAGHFETTYGFAGAFSPDGKLVFTWGLGEPLTGWDLKTGDERFQIELDGEASGLVCLGDDHKALLAINSAGKTMLIDYESGKIEARYAVDNLTGSKPFNATGRPYLVCRRDDRSAYVLDVLEEEKVTDLDESAEPLAIVPDEGALMLMRRDDYLFVDPLSNEKIAWFKADSQVNQVGFTEHGEYMVVLHGGILSDAVSFWKLRE